MADPVAVITYTDTPIAATSLPTQVDLDGMNSTPGDGSSISSYQWHLLQKPPGSSANLVNPTLGLCTLDDIDLPGTYYVFLVVTNDLGHTSFNQPTPKQLGVAPYTFTAPPASALKTVTVLTANAGLIKVAPGERDWLARGLWPLVEEVDALRGEHDDLQTDFDNHAIADHDTTATGAQLNTMTGGASSDASSLHTHTSIPATTIGTLGTDLINGTTNPALGVDIGASEVALRGALKSKLGSAAVSVKARHPGVLFSQKVDQTTTGTSAEVITLASTTVPANTLSGVGAVLRYRVTLSQASTPNNNTYEVLYAGTVVWSYSVKFGTTAILTLNIDIISWLPGGGGGEVFSTSNVTAANNMGAHAANHALANTLQFRVTTPDSAGSCQVVHASAEVIEA